MNVLGVIPARWGSSRFPGKPLARIHGRPMIAWVVRSALAAKSLDRVIVATDDERIVTAALEAGAGVFVSQKDFQSGTERVAAAARGRGAEIVVNIQGDEPLIEAADIDRLIEALQSPAGSGFQIASLYYEGTRGQQFDENSVKTILMGQDRAETFSRKPDPLHFLPLVHIGIYAFRAMFLKQAIEMEPTEGEKRERLEQLRWLENGAQIMMLRASGPMVAVDCPADLRKVEYAQKRA